MIDKLCTEPGPGILERSSCLEGLAMGGKMGETQESAMVCVNVLELVDSLDPEFLRIESPILNHVN